MSLIKNLLMIFIISGILSLLLIIYSLYSLTSTIQKQISINKIVTGAGNPGKIIIYSWKDLGFTEKLIDTGFDLVHTVRIGDTDNDNKNEIIAGIGNSFFRGPYGCRVVVYKIKGDGWAEDTIDNVGDLRCKDLTIGDADNDNKNEIVLGTHGEGVVTIYKWNNTKWSKTVLERNWIAKMDEIKNTSHRVPRENITYDTIVQTAVHIVKIGDVYNNNRNQVIATMSSPLESLATEISYIKVYEWNGKRWIDSIVDELEDREFRSIVVGDIYNKGKNELLVGIGSPGDRKGSVYIYDWNVSRWDKKLLYNDTNEKNMKGLTIGDVYNDGKNRIVLATGFPDGIVSIFEWNGKKFDRKIIDNISSSFNMRGWEFNSMAAEIQDVDGDDKNEILVSGMTTLPKKIGWEATDIGFLVVYKWNGTDWTKRVLDNRSVLGMTTGYL